MGQIIMDIYNHQSIRYQRGNRAIKKKILDEFCAAHGYHRESAIRLLNRPVITDKTLKSQEGVNSILQ